MQHYYALILAGGGGTRLWPLSRRQKPKQMLSLTNDDSMFRVSVTRLAPLFTPERIYIVTGRDHIDALREDAPEIPAENFIVEPYGRDNAAAAGLALSVIHKRDPEAVVAMLTSDHHIGKVDRFREVLRAAHTVASRGHIVTLGIHPDHPATGFGYIQQGEKLGNEARFGYHRALRFTEKPDVIKATQFLATGQYSWNSGMFIWKTQTALSEFERQQPDMYQHLVTIRDVVDTANYEDTLNATWDKLKRTTIDYAIMEGARDMVVIPVDLGWSDVGTWESLYDVLRRDEFGNCAKGKVVDNRIILDTHNTLVFSDKLTVSIGLDDVVIIDTPDALLVCHKTRTQDVKEIVQYLKDTNRNEYL